MLRRGGQAAMGGDSGVQRVDWGCCAWVSATAGSVARS